MLVFVRPVVPHSMLVLSINSACEVQHKVIYARTGILTAGYSYQALQF